MVAWRPRVGSTSGRLPQLPSFRGHHGAVFSSSNGGVRLAVREVFTVGAAVAPTGNTGASRSADTSRDWLLRSGPASPIHERTWEATAARTEVLCGAGAAGTGTGDEPGVASEESVKEGRPMLAEGSHARLLIEIAAMCALLLMSSSDGSERVLL